MHYLFAAVLLLLTSAAPVLAADDASEDLKLGSRDEFRTCLDSEEKMNDLRRSYEEQAAASRETMLLVQKEGASLVEDQKILDYTDEKQIQAFNKRTEEHNKRVKAANEQVRKLRADHDSYDEASLKYNRHCGTLLVNADDREAVLYERRAAAAQQAVSAQQASSTAPATEMAKPAAADTGPKTAATKQLLP